MKHIYGSSYALGLTLAVLLAAFCQPSPAGPTPGLYQIQLKSIDEKATTLEPFRNQVLMIVNTASQCGYTPQYAALEKIYEKYRAQGLVVLGFPSNDFGHQEPGTNGEIKAFCKGKYQVQFPMFEKGSVSGSAPQPLFAYLLRQTADQSAVAWNFEKFIVGRDGKLIQRFKSSVTPDSDELVKVLTSALDAPSAKK